jgi:hypothetical protein
LVPALSSDGRDVTSLSNSPIWSPRRPAWAILAFSLTRGERPWLRRVLARLEATAKSVRDKRSRLRGAGELLALGQRLMQAAETGGEEPRQRAQHYRDGLMIATLACRPLRLSNLVGLELGRQLKRRDGGW